MFSFFRNLFKSNQSDVLDSDFDYALAREAEKVKTDELRKYHNDLLEQLVNELSSIGVIRIENRWYTTKKGYKLWPFFREQSGKMFLGLESTVGGSGTRQIEVDCNSSILIKTCASLVINFINNN